MSPFQTLKSLREDVNPGGALLIEDGKVAQTIVGGISWLHCDRQWR
ncbi:hypothetical protein JOE31_002709 [Arthrobacter sp. PvP023]|nr:hypothetical protein [Arthrobacter sp. PvP023]MBP1136477.1 hypothetical protein [Arthrobacter sp. PvP023]